MAETGRCRDDHLHSTIVIAARRCFPISHLECEDIHMRYRPGFNVRELLSSFTTNLRSYKYQSLSSSTSLRLLEVHHVTETNVKYSLKAFKIEDAPPFHALSYTWGYPLISGLAQSKSNSWKRLGFLQRVEAKSPRLLRSAGHDAFPSQKITETTSCFPISCDGQNMRVTANLYDALAMLAGREVTKLTQHKYVWIDAICIWECYPY